MNQIVESNTHAVAPRQPKPIDTVRGELERMKDQFAMVLPKHLTPERLLRVALTACQQTPKLLDCDRKSLYSAIMRSAQLGLEPDGVLGQAYLIPYGKTVTFIPGYKGLIDLARRSGEVSNIIAKEVYENDEFDVDFSQEIPFVHKPKLEGDRGKLTHFWAMARFKDGGFHWDYMSVAEVEAIRDKGNGKGNQVWKDYFVEMGKKTAIRRIAKYLPMSVQRAAVHEDLYDAGKQVTYNDFGEIIVHEAPEETADTTKKIGTAAVKENLRSRKQKPEHDPETGEVYGENGPAATLARELREENQAAAATTIRTGADGREPLPASTQAPAQQTAAPTASATMPVATGDPIGTRKKQAQDLLENLQAAEPEDRDDMLAKAGGQNFIMQLNKDGQYELVKAIKKAAGIS